MTRQISSDIDIEKTTVLKLWHTNKCRPYKVQFLDVLNRRFPHITINDSKFLNIFWFSKSFLESHIRWIFFWEINIIPPNKCQICNLCEGCKSHCTIINGVVKKRSIVFWNLTFCFDISSCHPKRNQWIFSFTFNRPNLTLITVY